MRKRAGVTTLRQRRIELSDKIVAKCIKKPRFSGWFPLNDKGRSSARLKNKEPYQEKFSRCERFRNSPVFYETET